MRATIKACLPKTIALTEAQIRNLLPHREPLLLLRHATENVIGERVTAIARQNDRLQIPSRLHLLEGLGQTSCLLIRQMDRYADKGLVVFAAMRNVRWMNVQGDGVVSYTAVLGGGKERFGRVEARAEVGGCVLCRGELSFSFLEKD